MALSGQVFPAPCFCLNSDYMLANIEVPVPDWSQLKSADNVASAKSLALTHENPPLLKCKNVLVVPPLVIASIMGSKSTNPKKLLVNLLKDIEIYNRDSGDKGISEKLRPVIEFLWAAASDNTI
ncbi:MAG: hypothetical protein ACK53Y_21255, partial [bacterium]